jgi:hypothetical protein
MFRLGLIASILLMSPQSAKAQFDFGLIDPALLSAAIPQDVADEAIRMVGNFTAHRAYQGATPISRYNSFDLNIEATLVKIGPGIIKALQSAGATSLTTTDYKSLPIIKLNLRKSLNEKADLGFSGIGYVGQLILGGDVRFILHEPEEGPTWGMRISYNYANLPAVTYVRSQNTIQTEVVASRPLDFAEPYIGLGGRYMWGTMDVPLESPPISATKTGSAFDLYAFTGVYFHIIGPQGLRMGVEGSYNLSSYHTLGTVFGLGF